MSALTDRLGQIKIWNAHYFAERGEARVFITFQRDHPDAQGYKQYRAYVYVRVDGEWRRKTFRPLGGIGGRGIPEVRQDCLIQAQDWVNDRGLVPDGAEWVAGPFPDSWQLKETRDRVLALLKDLEAAQT